MSASTVLFEGLRISISLLWVRISNCSRLSLYLWTARRMVITCFSVGKRYRAGNPCAGTFRGLHDLLCGLIHQLMIVPLDSDSDFFFDCHVIASLL